MNYSFVAGTLVSLSFLLLFVDTLSEKHPCRFGGIFVGLYALGVVCWLVLGVLKNNIELVFISIFQVLLLGLYWSQRSRVNE